MHLSPVLLVLPLVLGGGDAAERTTRTHSFGPLAARMPEVSTPRYGTFLLSANEGEEPVEAPGFLSRDFQAEPVDAPRLLYLLVAHFESAAEPPALDIFHDSIVAVATEAQHLRIAEILRELRPRLSASIQVEVEFWSLPPGRELSAPSSLDAEELATARESLAASGRVLWTGTLETMPGRIVSGGALQRIPYVESHGVEIASKATIAAPVRAVLPAGVAIALHATPVRDGGGHHVVALASRADASGLTRFDTQADGVGSVEIPRLTGVRLAGSATLQPDGALVLQAFSNEMESTVVIVRPVGKPLPWRLTTSFPATGDGKERMAIVPLQALASPFGRELPLLDASLARVHEIESSNGVNVADLILAYEESLSSETIGGNLMLWGPEANLAQALKSAQALEETELPSASFRIALVRARDARSALGTAPIVASARVGTTLRRSAGVVLGRQETAVTGYSVEVAEEAQIAGPVVATFFQGVVGRLRLLESVEGKALVETDLLSSEFGPRERVVSATKYVGDLERVATRSSSIRRVVEIAPGEAKVLGELGTAPPGGDRLFAVLVLLAPVR